MKVILIYPIALVIVGILCWFIGNSDPSSSHALAFIFHQDGIIFSLIYVVAVLSAVLCTAGTIYNWFAITTHRIWWIVSIVSAFAVYGFFAYSRSEIKNNPNVAFRYHQFAVLKGWESAVTNNILAPVPEQATPGQTVTNDSAAKSTEIENK